MTVEVNGTDIGTRTAAGPVVAIDLSVELGMPFQVGDVVRARQELSGQLSPLSPPAAVESSLAGFPVVRPSMFPGSVVECAHWFGSIGHPLGATVDHYFDDLSAPVSSQTGYGVAAVTLVAATSIPSASDYLYEGGLLYSQYTFCESTFGFESDLSDESSVLARPEELPTPRLLDGYDDDGGSWIPSISEGTRVLRIGNIVAGAFIRVTDATTSDVLAEGLSSWTASGEATVELSTGLAAGQAIRIVQYLACGDESTPLEPDPALGCDTSRGPQIVPPLPATPR